METSYYAKVAKRDLPRVVSISVGNPKWLAVQHFAPHLAPTYTLLSAFRASKITEAQYIHGFSQLLNVLDPQDTYDQLLRLHPNPILCCHCQHKHFCHRHLVAEWFNIHLGVRIPEYGFGDVNRRSGYIIQNKYEQGLLF